jgi:hypothetical protein
MKSWSQKAKKSRELASVVKEVKVLREVQSGSKLGASRP